MSEPSPRFLVRPMTVADLDGVIHIEQRAHPAAWPRDAYRHELEQNEFAHYFVLQTVPAAGNWLRRLRRQGGEEAALLAYGGFWMMVDEAHISTLATDPDWRGQGLGELLLLEMIEASIPLGAVAVTLEVRVSNLAARRLYEKYRMEITGLRPRYYRDNREDAHIMTVTSIRDEAYRAFLAERRAGLAARHQAAAAERLPVNSERPGE